MPTEAENTGFLSRWSGRKALARQGLVVPEPKAPPAAAQAVAVAKSASTATELAGAAAALSSLPAAPLAAQTSPSPLPEAPAHNAAVAEAEPPPTLEDVAGLTRDSDYSRFIARSVQPEVKNAALAKLFTDPHFNVMDRLDVYIDDYGKPDPLPPGMLRQMLQAHGLGLFDHEKEIPPAAGLDLPLTDQAQTQAQASAQTPAQIQELAPDGLPTCAAAPPTEPAAHENTDLQLQPDDDAGCPGAAQRAGQDAAGAH